MAVTLPMLAFAKKVALTIDDAPLKSGLIYTGVERTKKIINVLSSQQIQTAFFCNSDRLDVDQGRERLQAYSHAGHIIGNHTSSHTGLDGQSMGEFISEVDRADLALRDFPTFKKWFRFPFLREGKTVYIRDGVRGMLQSRGYINAYVTLDNYDYAINDFVQKALQNKLEPDLNHACEMLSDLNLFGLEEQNLLAKKHLGKEVMQVILMHENDSEAYCLEQSIAKIRKAGWQIISPVQAFQDPTLGAEPNTLWLEHGRVAAVVAAKDGTKYKSKWDSTDALNAEMNRRKILPSSGSK